MDSCADHLHWAGGAWQSSRSGEAHAKSGGGHAHSGAMVYLGGAWPEEYRNNIFMCNIHGSRLNRDLLERRGAGYVARHGEDFLLANDPWFRGVAVHGGPDGSVYVSDWCDTGECHNYDQVHRENGRIYKITYGQPGPWRGDLAKLSNAELVQAQRDKNDWHVRHARRLLQERAAVGKLSPDVDAQLRKMVADEPDVPRKLRALWALHAIGWLDSPLLGQLLDHPRAEVRLWAVRLGLDDPRPTRSFLTQLAKLAASTSEPSIQLELASALQRLPLGERWAIAEALARNPAEIPVDVRASTGGGPLRVDLMFWYGIEPLVPADRERAWRLVEHSKHPMLPYYFSRRVVLLDDRGLEQLLGWVAGSGPDLPWRHVLSGISDALEGRRSVPMPPSWPAAAARLAANPDRVVRERARALGAQFGDARALAELRKLAADPTEESAWREPALYALMQKRSEDLVPLLQSLLDDGKLRRTALRGLADYADPGIPEAILRRYGSLTDDEKADAVQTLASRASSALRLLEAVESGKVARRDLSAFTVRQMLGLKSPALTAKLNKVWGTLRPASQEKAPQMARYKKLLTPGNLQSADPSRGRLVFARTCGSCHRLFDDGGAIGPDLTGSQRTNLDYVLENVLDPSAIVYGEYQVTVVETRDGRLVNGIVKQETAKALTLQTQNEQVVLPKDEIASRTRSPLSLMPEGLFANLKDDEVRDLVAYLASPSQVPLPRTK
jgi:putative heme-binding domain-containing protein